MRSATPSAAVLTTLLAGLSAQEADSGPGPETELRGTVAGFSGEPGAFATVRVFSQRGHRLGEVVTAADGRFSYRSPEAPGQVEVQLEGVVRKVPLAGLDPAAIAITFEDARHYTLRGRLIDPAGQGLQDTDMLVRDHFDRTLVNVTTTERGEFAVRLDAPVRSIVVDPLGLDWVQEFETAASRELTIDLRYVDGAEFFSIDGRVLDATGSPVPGALVRAGSSKRVRVQRTARADGSFVLWSRRPLEYLIALHGSRAIACHFATLDRPTSIELDAVRHGYVTIEGRVTDKNGAAAPDVRIYGADHDDRPLLVLQMFAISGPDGTFTASVPRELPRLLALSNDGTGTAGWQIDHPVELVVR